MDEIRIEILPYIFLNLPLEDLFNCKLVCKKWLFALRHWVKIRELVVFVEEEPINGKWADLQIFDCLHSLRLSSDRYLSRRNTKLNFEEPLFSNLKKLFIQRRTLVEDADKCIEGLNKFQALEELILPTIQLHKDTRLSLPRLKRLTLDKVFGRRLTLFLDTPRLEQLRVFSNKRIQFACESVSLKRIQAFHFYPSAVFAGSLQYLFCYYVHNLKDDFLAAGELRELHVFAESSTFATLKAQKRNLPSGKDVKLFFKGLQLDGVHDQVEELLFAEVLDAKYLDSYLRNYDKLASFLPYLFIVKYDPFEKLADRLPPDFLGRFVALQKVIVSKRVQNEDNFLKFLKCIRVESLKLRNTTLTQDFYSLKLPAICPHIESVKIVEDERLIEQLDLEFIFQLKHLFDCCTNKNLDTEFVGRAFKELPYFRYFSFNFRSRRTIVNNLYRNDDYEFRLKLTDVNEKAKVFRTFEVLASELNEFDGRPVAEPEPEYNEEELDGELDLENEADVANRVLNLGAIEMNFHILDNENEDVREMLQLGIDRREDINELNREMQDFENMNLDQEDDQDSLDESEADPDFYHFRDL